MTVNLFAQNINLLAVLVSAVLVMVVGFVWYQPRVFGNMWMAAQGKTEADFPKDSSSPTPYMIMFVGALVTALVLQWFLKTTGATTLASTLRVASSIWVAFTFFPMVANGMFHMRTWKLLLIDSVYFLVNFVLMGLVFFYWK